MSAPQELAAAYAECEAITRREAANFFYGIRLLPRKRRQAMCAAYAFARRVDDIGDGPLETAEKLRRLDAAAQALAAIEPGAEHSSIEHDRVTIALADAATHFPLSASVLGELIEGVRMDVEGVTYETFEELVLYCRRVAGAIGRVCLAIFGLREQHAGELADAQSLADDLGVALQLTNILRDVREDAENGRVYLPLADLRSHRLIAAGEERDAPRTLAALARSLDRGATGDGSADGAPGVPPEELQRYAALVRFEAERARLWFQHGITLTELLDRRSAACVLAMAGIYRRVLERIERDPEESIRRRISLPAQEKAWVAVLSMIGGRA